MSVYVTKPFIKFVRRAELKDQALLAAARAVPDGRWDASLGGGVFKQQIAHEGGGKSGGFRSIIVFKDGRHTFFVHGFAKNEKGNITDQELKAFKTLAKTHLALDAGSIATASAAGEIKEIRSDEKDHG